MKWGPERVSRMATLSTGAVCCVWLVRVMIRDIAVMVGSSFHGSKVEIVTSILFTNGKTVGSDFKRWSNRSASSESGWARRVWKRSGLLAEAKARQDSEQAERAALLPRRKSMMCEWSSGGSVGIMTVSGRGDERCGQEVGKRRDHFGCFYLDSVARVVLPLGIPGLACRPTYEPLQLSSSLSPPMLTLRWLIVTKPLVPQHCGPANHRDHPHLIRSCARTMSFVFVGK